MENADISEKEKAQAVIIPTWTFTTKKNKNVFRSLLRQHLQFPVTGFAEV